MKHSTYKKSFKVGNEQFSYFDIKDLITDNNHSLERLPFSIRILVENLLRKFDNYIIKENDLKNITNWQTSYISPVEIPYHPARVLMQDFTGVPAVVDLAAMRDAVADLGGDPAMVNPLVPTELVVDHSVQIDFSGTQESLNQNVEKEYARNKERYTLLKWAQKSFNNFNVVPPNSGICHQVNLEYLGRVVITDPDDSTLLAYPDTVVGLDSHTPMINGIGVMGWGVGGIEAEAVMLGQPYYMSIPEVVGVKLVGKLKAGITATDMVLTITELLRSHNVVEKFVEYFGPGIQNLSIPDRATISNMTPEYGATLGFFPVDIKTLEYLEMTNRKHQAKITEVYTKTNNLFFSGNEHPEYSQIVELDLATVVPSLAGPARPQDRICLTNMKTRFEEILGNKTDQPQKNSPLEKRKFDIVVNNTPEKIGDGSVVVAAITSCTNTSNPHVLMGAGLLARNAVKKGLRVPPFVKTSFAPGSKVVENYLNKAQLTPYLEALGFHLAAFGCTTCIGNSGPLNPEIEEVITKKNLNVAAVLSGNRNFEARIHQNIKSNFLASPMLVVAFALAGKVDIDLTQEPLGMDPNGTPVFLKDLWPTDEEIDTLVKENISKEGYAEAYDTIFDGDTFWQELQITKSTTFPWDPQSTYIKKPPYFDKFTSLSGSPADIQNARPFLILGDSVTTDHISPAGAIPPDYPAGKYLLEHGVEPSQFNSYGSRRGNHEVMMRGTFGNIRIKNKMVGSKEGSYTVKNPENEVMYIYKAAMAYVDQNVPLVVLGGKEYGTGSSRDWAAKGTMLLGIKVVLSNSFERIHRNNLVGMGVLPLVFKDGENAEGFKLDGTEFFSISGLESMQPGQNVEIEVTRENGERFSFQAQSRLDTDIDVAYYEHGGILPYVLRKIIQ